MEGKNHPLQRQLWVGILQGQVMDL